MPEMKLAKSSHKINLAAWKFVKEHPNNCPKPKTIAKYVNETVKEVFAEDPPWADLPFQYGGSDGRYGKKSVKDPLTLFVNLPLGDSNIDEVYWEISIRDLVKDFLWMNSNALEEDDVFQVDHPQCIKKCRALAAALREQADFIERAITED